MNESQPKTLNSEERIKLAEEHAFIMYKIAKLGQGAEAYQTFLALTKRKDQIEQILGHQEKRKPIGERTQRFQAAVESIDPRRDASPA